MPQAPTDGCRGFCCNWELQRPIWERSFGKDGLQVLCRSLGCPRRGSCSGSREVTQVKVHDTCLLLTEPMMNLPELQASRERTHRPSGCGCGAGQGRTRGFCMRMQKGMDEFVFEEFGFHSLYCSSAPNVPTPAKASHPTSAAPDRPRRTHPCGSASAACVTIVSVVVGAPANAKCG